MTTLEERKRRAQSGEDLPRRIVPVTFLSGEKLFNEVQSLTNQLIDHRIAKARKTDDEVEAEKRTRKGSQKAPLSEADIEARIAQIQQDEMPSHQAPCEIVGMTSGEWQRWREKHPPRIIGYRETTKPNGDVETGDPIYHPDDIELTHKIVPWQVAPSCNAAEVDELLLDRFITTVDGEELEPGGWLGWLADAILWNDRRILVRTVVVAHEEQMMRLPKAPVASTTPSSSANSDKPAT
jgi:hypothetical protein